MPPRSRQIVTVRCLRSVLTGAAVLAVSGALAGASAAAPLAIHVNGNEFVNGDGNVVRLTGTGADSTEYACEFGYAYGNYDAAAEADAMAAWKSNATRIPLNQDCWLGTHGYPKPGSAMLTAAGYRSYIEQFVAEANHDGMYVILDLHFSGPNGSSGQRQMPDADSITFWESVASAFKNDPAVIFDVFNEPLSSTDGNAPSGDGLQPVSWGCWESGGCLVSDYDLTYSSSGGPDYTAVGMQQLVDAIRSVGATQPIILGGLNFSGDLSQWLAHEPTDDVAPSQLAASFHDYDSGVCQGTACLAGLSDVQSVAAHVPVVTGEFGYLYGDNAICTEHDSTDFANEYMNWADQNGISYLAFAWITPTLADDSTEDSCDNVESHPGSEFSAHLINDDGSPAVPLGVEVHDHLASVVNVTSPGPGVPTITPITPGTTPPPPHATGSRLSLHGLRRGAPVLSFKLSDAAAAISTIAIKAPARGLSFAHTGRRLQRGVVVTTTAGHQVRGTVQFSHGKLRIALAAPASSITVTIRAPALTETTRLRARAKAGKAKTLTLRISTVDVGGASSAITL